MSTDIMGNIKLPLSVERESSDVTINDVYFVPQLKVNLLSVSQIVSKGHTVVFKSDGAKVYNSSKEIIASATHARNLFELNRAPINTCGSAMISVSSEREWSTLLEKKKEDAVKEKDLFCFPKQEPTEQTRKYSEKADLEGRNEVDISEPENGSSNKYVDVISDVDVNQNDSDYLPEIELGEENAPPVQRHQRVRRAPEAMKDYVTYSAMVEADGDPLTVEDALSRPDKDKWFQAMQNEYDALIQNATWDLVDLPPEKRPLNCNTNAENEEYSLPGSSWLFAVCRSNFKTGHELCSKLCKSFQSESRTSTLGSRQAKRYRPSPIGIQWK
ncbi:hypothetical protein JTB14_011303 [Gonioctena quinquepunctata]|nr:hypothetical protein JTB14_011303 [Gonioctena quinquepunctata]